MDKISIEMENIDAGYQKDIKVLRDVSIRAKDREITGIIGPNGSGKSTLLKVICGHLAPMKGEIYYNGKDITGWRSDRLVQEGIIHIPQESALFPSLTVEENLKLGCWTFREDEERVNTSIEGIYERYPVLKERRNLPSTNLSGGERRVLEVERALLLDPDFLLVDEPTAGLQPTAQRNIYDRLREISKNRDIILVEQNIRKVVELADYLYIMKGGKIYQEGSREEFESKLSDIISDWLI